MMLQNVQTVTTMTPEGEPGWRTALDVFVALSTVAVAWFAWVEIQSGKRQREAAAKRLEREREDREAAADARISPVAYGLRRQLRVFLAAMLHGDEFEWQWDTLEKLDAAEDRLHLLLGEGDASVPVKQALRDALQQFYAARSPLDLLASAVSSAGTARTQPLRLQKEEKFATVETNLRACLSSLSRVIDPELRGAERPKKELGK